MSQKIVFTGVTSFRNHGVEALVVSAVAQLRARLPGATFTVLDRDPEFDRSRVPAAEVRFAQDYTIRSLYAGRLRNTLTRAVPSLDRYAESARAEIASASAVIASGGDVFASEYGHRSLLTHLAPLKIARKHGKPFFLAAHSIGPFKNDTDREAFVGVAQDAAGITVREAKSFAYVTQELGLPTSLVTLTADAAFLLSKPGPERLAKLRAYHGFTGPRPVIALTPSQAICNWMNSNYDQHFKVWCAVVDMLVRELDAGIIFIPHVQETSPKNDDRVLATEIVRHFNFDPRLQIAGGDYSASEFKGIISQCDLVVAERMHACIAGLSSAVCTVAIGYSVKAEGILCDLFELEQVQNGLLLPIKDFLDERTACEKVRRAWQMRAAVAARLRARLPDVQRRAGVTFDLIAEAVMRKETQRR
jgi:colanic acid/amylovoran biosynthesis protein